MSSTFSDDTARFLAVFTDTRTGNAGFRAMKRAEAIRSLTLPLSGGWRLPLETARAMAAEDGGVTVLVAIDQLLARMDYPAQPYDEGRTYRCSGPGSKRGYMGTLGARHPDCIADNGRRSAEHFGARHMPRALQADEVTGAPKGAERYTLKPGTVWTWDPERKRYTGMIRTVQNACKQCRSTSRHAKRTG